MRKPNPRSPSIRPWHPAAYGIDDIYALQALNKGVANEIQQARALKYIVETVCKTYDADFVPDSERESNFAAGKRHVGLEIVKLVNMPKQAVEALKIFEQNRLAKKETRNG